MLHQEIIQNNNKKNTLAILEINIVVEKNDEWAK